jgi:hypothetical protein
LRRVRQIAKRTISFMFTRLFVCLSVFRSVCIEKLVSH